MSIKNIVLYKWFNFFLGLCLYAPVAIIYFSTVSGSYALGASIFAIVMLVSAIGEVPTGIWSDKLGRKQTILIGSVLSTLSVVAYAIGINYGWLVVGAVLEGFSRSFYSGNNDAFLYESLIDDNSADQFDDALGKSHSMEHIGIALGAAFGGILASYSYQWLMWISVLPQLISVLLTTLMTEPKNQSKNDSNIYSHTKEAIKLFFTNKKIRLLSISDAISFSTGEVSYQFRATYFSSIWPIWAIGVLNTSLQIGASISYYFSAQMIKYFGHAKLLLVRSIIGKASGLIAFGIPSIFSPIITFFPSFFYGSGQVAKTTLMQREFSAHQRATMSSLNSLLSNLSFAFMSIVVGVVADHTTPQIALLGLTIISLPIIGIYYKLFSDKDRT